jgi:hypothetical protein
VCECKAAPLDTSSAECIKFSIEMRSEAVLFP